jgi:hypothetical protein
MDSCEISAPQFATENGYNTYRIPFTVIQINLQSEYPAGELISDSLPFHVVMRNPIADVVKRVPSAYHSQPELGGYPKQTVLLHLLQ